MIRLWQIKLCKWKSLIHSHSMSMSTLMMWTINWRFLKVGRTTLTNWIKMMKLWRWSKNIGKTQSRLCEIQGQGQFKGDLLNYPNSISLKKETWVDDNNEFPWKQWSRMTLMPEFDDKNEFNRFWTTEVQSLSKLEDLKVKRIQRQRKKLMLNYLEFISIQNNCCLNLIKR